MHRFFSPHLTQHATSCDITDRGEVHHLRDVLRLKAGDEAMLFNGQGLEARAVICSLSAREACFSLLSSRVASPDPVQITLACAIPKKSKFEWIVEKATELGVNELIPLQTARTEIKMSAAGGKVNRWQAAALGALKQCGRLHLPVIHPILKFSDALPLLLERGPVVMPSLVNAQKTLMDVLKALPRTSHLSFLIGPEGDFTPEEYTDAHARGCQAVSLGESILKVETAAICVVSCARQFLLELR